VTEMLTIDPELEGLLRELAADPESSLLKVPREKQIPSLFLHSTAVEAHARNLIVTERHLLATHRAELSGLLRQACLLRLVEGPDSRLYLYRHITATRSCTPFDIPTLKSRLNYSRRFDTPLSEHLSATELLERCVTTPHSRTPSVCELATASLRLEPTESARILAAIELSHGLSPRTSLTLLEGVLARNPTRREQLSALTHIGLAHSKFGAFDKARNAYRAACFLDESVLIGWIGFLLMSLQMGDATGSLQASQGLEQATQHKTCLIEDWAERLEIRRLSNEWRPTDKALITSKQIKDRLGSAGRRLADVMA
jgi:hypothetical protein